MDAEELLSAQNPPSNLSRHQEHKDTGDGVVCRWHDQSPSPGSSMSHGRIRQKHAGKQNTGEVSRTQERLQSWKGSPEYRSLLVEKRPTNSFLQA